MTPLTLLQTSRRARPGTRTPEEEGSPREAGPQAPGAGERDPPRRGDTAAHRAPSGGGAGPGACAQARGGSGRRTCSGAVAAGVGSRRHLSGGDAES